jgi:hypothetical protein
MLISSSDSSEILMEVKCVIWTPHERKESPTWIDRIFAQTFSMDPLNLIQNDFQIWSTWAKHCIGGLLTDS